MDARSRACDGRVPFVRFVIGMHLTPKKRTEPRAFLTKLVAVDKRGYPGKRVENASAVYLQSYAGVLSDLATVYKDLHGHPESWMQEGRTAGVPADRLVLPFYEVTAGIGKTGLVGLFRNAEGLSVMLRADMDALAVRKPQVSLTPAS